MFIVFEEKRVEEGAATLSECFPVVLTRKKRVIGKHNCWVPAAKKSLLH